MTPSFNSRGDLERLRGTDQFEKAMRSLHGGMTTWSLENGGWVAKEDLGAIKRLGYTKAEFLDEIAPFEFPDPVAPPKPRGGNSQTDQQIVSSPLDLFGGPTLGEIFDGN